MTYQDFAADQTEEDRVVKPEDLQVLTLDLGDSQPVGLEQLKVRVE